MYVPHEDKKLWKEGQCVTVTFIPRLIPYFQMDVVDWDCCSNVGKLDIRQMCGSAIVCDVSLPEKRRFHSILIPVFLSYPLLGNTRLE